MKRKILQNSLVVAVMAMTFCLSAAVLVTSCQKRDYPTASQQKKMNEKLSYLEFKTGYTGIGEPTGADTEVIISALERMKISKKDGRLQIGVPSSKEANVSSEVFKYIQQMVDRYNVEAGKKGNTDSKPIDLDKIIIR